MTVTAPVTVHIPPSLRKFTDGAALLPLDAAPATVRDALLALFARHPGVRDRVLTEQGQVRTHVNVFVGPESIRYSGGLDTPVPAEAELFIVPAVSGGAPDGEPPRPSPSPNGARNGVAAPTGSAPPAR